MKENALKAKIGIYGMSMLSMATLILSPVISAIVAEFPDKSVSEVQMILSISSLTGVIAAFVVGKLAVSISKRTIALIGELGILIFGLLPFFYHSNLVFLIVCSGLIGVACGFITNTIPGLIADYFPVDERQGAMGKQTVFVNIGTMIMMFLSGILGASGWHMSYLTYLLAGIVLIITAVCLPKDDKIEKDAMDQAPKNSGVLSELNGFVYAIAICGFFYMLIFNAYNNNISLLISQQFSGDSSTAGTISTITTLGGLIAGLLMAQIAKIIKTKNMLGSAFLVTACGLLIIFFSTNIPLLAIGSFLVGAAQSMFFAQAPFLITIVVKPIFITMAMAVLSTANAIGGFLSPTIINGLNSATLDGSAKGAMIIVGILSAIMAVLVFLTKLQEKSLAKSSHE